MLEDVSASPMAHEGEDLAHTMRPAQPWDAPVSPMTPQQPHDIGRQLQRSTTAMESGELLALIGSSDFAGIGCNEFFPEALRPVSPVEELELRPTLFKSTALASKS